MPKEVSFAKYANRALSKLSKLSHVGPQRFDARSSRGGWPERTLKEHPHVLVGGV
jgi:hypothetical protein